MASRKRCGGVQQEQQEPDSESSNLDDEVCNAHSDEAVRETVLEKIQQKRRWGTAGNNSPRIDRTFRTVRTERVNMEVAAAGFSDEEGVSEEEGEEELEPGQEEELETSSRRKRKRVPKAVVCCPPCPLQCFMLRQYIGEGSHILDGRG